MAFKDTFFSSKKSINCGGQLIDLSIPRVMGIINVTSDSFYPGSCYEDVEDILKRVEQIIHEGGSFIDLGATSSRPGKKLIQTNDEIAKLTPVFEAIKKKFPEVIISLDTYNSATAKWAIENFRIPIINDISAGNIDPHMFRIIADYKVAYIIMHMQGIPENMQLNPRYSDLIKEIIIYFSSKVEQLKVMGVNDVIIDPGFGFGKTIEHNFSLMNKLDAFKIFELPLLVGISRKSMIYKVLNTTPGEALNGTTSLNTVALLSGADILRVHDVKEAMETITLVEKLKSS